MKWERLTAGDRSYSTTTPIAPSSELAGMLDPLDELLSVLDESLLLEPNSEFTQA